ncbi:MAG: transporter substrate-binding domain-containing protein [Flavobacteriales bacterium]|nr:transporter substrate-binding domain-containing protein [Flavobacteriales bacterium]
MRKGLLICVALGILVARIVSSCSPAAAKPQGLKLPPPIAFDLDSILARDTLILLTENSATSYYKYRGQPRGYDYEMVKAFARHLGVKLKVEVLDDVDEMFEKLNKGEGDLIATHLTATSQRSQYVAFGPPVCATRQVVVQRIPEPGDSTNTHIADTNQLAGKEIWVHKYSVFHSRLQEMNGWLPDSIKIHEAPGEISTDDLLRLVSEGEIDFTITDENLAQLQQADYPNLDMQLAITGNQPIAWAMRKNAVQLQIELALWMLQPPTTKKFASTYRKYFSHLERINYSPVFVPPIMSDNRISPYDELFKKHAADIHWDWRLLAALVYHESRFNPEARSWSGAFGLMQLMPETAMKLGCDTTQKEEPNIKAGVRYIKHLENMWREKIKDDNERLKFVLASYNIGPGHVFDAREIARQTGRSDTVWNGHVAECLLLKMQERYYTMPGVKHGYCYAKEPYQFVDKILNTFAYYKGLKFEP